MAKYCPKCGKSVKEGIKFCPGCGTALPSAAKQSESGRKFCRFCGNPVREGAKFCRTCGKSLAAGDEVSHKRQEVSVTQKEIKPQLSTQAAATTAGEVDLGIMSGEVAIPGMSGASKTSGRVLSPFGGIIHSIGSFLGGIPGIFRRPAALIGVLLLAALWIVLAGYRDSDSGIVNLLSFLTYAEGGFDRSGIGILGGILGKGTVAAGLLSLPCV